MSSQYFQLSAAIWEAGVDNKTKTKKNWYLNCRVAVTKKLLIHTHTQTQFSFRLSFLFFFSHFLDRCCLSSWAYQLSAECHSQNVVPKNERPNMKFNFSPEKIFKNDAKHKICKGNDCGMLCKRSWKLKRDRDINLYSYRYIGIGIWKTFLFSLNYLSNSAALAFALPTLTSWLSLSIIYHYIYLSITDHSAYPIILIRYFWNKVTENNLQYKCFRKFKFRNWKLIIFPTKHNSRLNLSLMSLQIESSNHIFIYKYFFLSFFT